MVLSILIPYLLMFLLTTFLARALINLLTQVEGETDNRIRKQVTFSNANFILENGVTEESNCNEIMTTTTTSERPSFLVGDEIENSIQEATEAVDAFPQIMENGVRQNPDLAERRKRLSTR